MPQLCHILLRGGPALTAVWSKAPPLSAHCLPSLPGFDSRPGHVKRFASDLGLGGGFAGYSGFLHYLQLACHELATIGINVTKNKIQIQKPIRGCAAIELGTITRCFLTVSPIFTETL